MLALALCALTHGARTWAADASAFNDPLPAAKAGSPSLPASVPSIDTYAFAPRTVLDSSTISVRSTGDDFSATEFRPRKRDQAALAKTDYGSSDPMFQTTTVWQRLNEFRAQDRVRVLTLWETGGSSVSIQTSKRGDPSLQWSSSWTKRSKVSHGLLDRLLAASLSGIANRGNNTAHYSPATSAPKPLITPAALIPPAK